LETARALSDRVVIVTNAMRPWVADCVDFFAPELQKHFVPEDGALLPRSDGGVRVVYARCTPRMRDYKGRPGPAESRSGDEYMTQEEMESYLTAAKTHAMRKEAREFYKQHPSQSWKNILSVGDASYEHDAVQELAFRRPSSKREKLRTKAIMLLEQPSISELTTGLLLARHLLPAFVRWDGDLDVDMGALQNPLSASC